jgi:hypothetical protein
MKNGDVHEARQPFMRGGAHAPLSTADVETKCVDNGVYGGFPRDRAEALRAVADTIYGAPNLDALKEFRS